jgi:hypothetical protein
MYIKNYFFHVLTFFVDNPSLFDYHLAARG